MNFVWVFLRLPSLGYMPYVMHIKTGSHNFLSPDFAPCSGCCVVQLTDSALAESGSMPPAFVGPFDERYHHGDCSTANRSFGFCHDSRQGQSFIQAT